MYRCAKLKVILTIILIAKQDNNIVPATINFWSLYNLLIYHKKFVAMQK